MNSICSDFSKGEKASCLKQKLYEINLVVRDTFEVDFIFCISRHLVFNLVIFYTNIPMQIEESG